jgi:hypothetical protein
MLATWQNALGPQTAPHSKAIRDLFGSRLNKWDMTKPRILHGVLISSQGKVPHGPLPSPRALHRATIFFDTKFWDCMLLEREWVPSFIRKTYPVLGGALSDHGRTCAQIKLTSSGTANPKGVALPGAYSPDDTQGVSHGT